MTFNFQINVSLFFTHPLIQLIHLHAFLFAQHVHVVYRSEMSWSDCFEVGRKSSKNGEYAMAKYWMETALEKLPAAPVAQSNAVGIRNSESEKAKFRILEGILNTEYKIGKLTKMFKNAKVQLLSIIK